MEIVPPIESILKRAKDICLDHSLQVEIAKAALNYHYTNIKSFIIGSYIEPTKENKDRVIHASDYADREKEIAEKMLQGSFSSFDDGMMDFCLRINAFDRAKRITAETKEIKDLFFNIALLAISYKIRFQYLVEKHINKNKINKDVFITNHIKSFPFYKDLNDENKGQVIRNVKAVLDE